MGLYLELLAGRGGYENGLHEADGMGPVSRTILTAGLAVLTALSLLSCGGPLGDGEFGALQSIAITPENPSMDLLETMQFSATGTYEGGVTRDLTNELSWSTADSGVAAAGLQGKVTSVSTGTTTVTATDIDAGISASTGLNSGCTAAVTNNGPVASRTGAHVTMGLSCADEATDYACITNSARICFSGPVDFETDAGPFTTLNAALAACGDNFVTDTNCTADDGAPDVLEFQEASSAVATVSGIDAARYTDLQVHLRAAFSPFTDINDNINVFACCGAGCTPAFAGSALNLESGGTDEWSERGPIELDTGEFDNCTAAAVSFSLQTVSVGEVAHMDDYAMSGTGTHAFQLMDNLDGTYTGGFAACAASTVEVSCMWSTIHGTFQADNTTFVSFY